MNVAEQALFLISITWPLVIGVFVRSTAKSVSTKKIIGIGYAFVLVSYSISLSYMFLY